ncbi:hypothetical protein DICVIV_11910 [Dictyocaulus viviparus]|uniref:RRM domain-containing protein n=1 Tax=Dictyocaulus viviparus TaxID=29172 RepID=A0A0D8XIE9_DICVI|nr:hypothetical protein DICVIV_11910 [Dictyocaulus viviparus]
METSQGPLKAFIGNLPFDGVEGDIEQILRHVGFDDEQIRSFRIRMIRDRETDKFKGFAYVEFNTADELSKVLELNGVEYGGRQLKIDVATQRSGTDRGGRSGNIRGRGRTMFDHNPDRGHSSSSHGFDGDQMGHQRFERQNEDSAIERHPERPRLVLKPRTTDPAELEAKRQREAEEEAARRAKLFIA